MMSQKNKTIVLGVTGSIAAYKAADLCSKLKSMEYDIKVIMTECATKLLGQQTFLTLSKNPVLTDLWKLPDWKPGHIELADEADLLIVAPATANFIAKFANGIADDALSTYALSHDKPVLVAPAMNTRMWNHPAVRKNCKTIKENGAEIIPPAQGMLACGDEGEGRLADINDIIEKIKITTN